MSRQHSPSLAQEAFSATAAGYERLLVWARGFGEVRSAGVEGTGSYGASLTRHLQAANVTVVEINRPSRAVVRHRRGKTDAIDAEHAARAVLANEATAQPKSADGPVEQLRTFKVAKDSAVKVRTQAINQLKGLLIVADPALRETLEPLSTPQLITACPGPQRGGRHHGRRGHALHARAVG